MRVRHVVGLALIAAAFASSVSVAPRAAASASLPTEVRGGHRSSLPYVPGELIVQFRRGVGATERTRSVRRAGCIAEEVLPGTAGPAGRTTLLLRSADLGTRSLMKRFSEDPTVAVVAPNYIRRIDAFSLDEPGLARQWGPAAVNAPDAWEITTGSPDVVVASIDTGVDVFHPDLADNVWQNPGEVAGNGLDDDGNGYVDDVYGIDAANGDVYPFDDVGHGTHTSGIMAAVGDNGAGIAGVSWHTRIMALKFISSQGWGTDVDALECIDYVVHQKVDHGVNVVAINASWGAEFSSLVLRNAIAAAGEAGIVFCASAGNDGVNADLLSHYPSAYDCPNILAVCASDGERLAGFSNWGAVATDLAAPGMRILSTWTDGRYLPMSGTSMAAPFVTGTVALLAARHPDESARERVQRIVSSVRPKAWLEGLCVSGGVLDVGAALGMADPSTDVTAPTTTPLGVPEGVAERSLVVNLYAEDGAAGSGVATTEWRLDDGKWTTGTRLVVSAPARTATSRTLEFRSTDNAGNVEDVKVATIAFDTRAEEDDVLPGVRLPASPVSGDAYRRADIYRLRLAAGETLKLATVDPLHVDFGVWVDPPGTRRGAGWTPNWLWPLTYRAGVSGRYYLRVSGGPYAFAYSVHPPGEDVTPPSVDIEQSDWSWSNLPVTFGFKVRDDKGGSGAGSAEVSLDEGLTWAAESQVVIDAPADHGNDGVHRVLVRGRDVAGNLSPVRWSEAWIDTEGPATRAWGPVDPVRQGRTAVVSFDADERGDGIYCVLIVRSAATGKVVFRKNAGWQSGTVFSADPWDQHPFRIKIRWLCTLPAGEYDVFIAGATHDEAGNRWVSATCKRPLVVE